ncbi:MAG: ATP-dependent zinc metalloprotease FtsH [Clostridia bacterium]|nr:ATP-dependent zinc metalloprotease FtsH [Clostridia bacterium]
MLVFLLVIVAFCVVYWLTTAGSNGEQIGYEVFVNEVEASHVDQVAITNKEIDIKYKDGKRAWFYNRESVEEDVIAVVKEYNSKVEAKNQANPSLKLTKINLQVGTSTTVNIFNILFPILLVASTIIMIVFFARMFRSANRSGMDFVKNRARVIPSKVKFDKVAGADEEKAELEEIIEFLKNPDKFTQIGARIPKGVLLVGPPGTGKTLLAKAVAGEANVPFFTISGSDFMELYVGVGASRVRDLFENAKRAKPCIVFIDEIDAVGRQRGTGLGGGNDEREQTLNQLLVQMDGFEQNEGIIVMAATNRADILDPALTRPGRFDRQIYISTPDVKGREEILRVHSEGKPLASDVSLKDIARVTTGFTGADLENLINEAAIFAARKNQKEIKMQDLNDAIVKVSMGPQKRSRVVTENDRKITAFHEAGHAVVEKCVKTSNPVHEVSIIQRGGAAGYTISRPANDESHMTRQKLIDMITMSLGGRASEELFLDDITTGASSDLSRATELARKMVTEWGMSSEIGLMTLSGEGEVFLGRDYQNRATYSDKEAALIDQEIKKIIDECYVEAKKILDKHKKHIKTMVDVLLEKETIYAEEVDMIMSGKTAKTVIAFIEEKQKEKEAKKQEAANTTPASENQENNDEDYVDKLLKMAEERARQKLENDGATEVKEENKKQSDIQSEQPNSEKTETKSGDNTEVKDNSEAQTNADKIEIVKEQNVETEKDSVAAEKIEKQPKAKAVKKTKSAADGKPKAEEGLKKTKKKTSTNAKSTAKKSIRKSTRKDTDEGNK